MNSRTDVEAAARAIHDVFGPGHVVVTGGHGGGEVASDCWFDGTEITWLEAERLPYAVHGAGDTFSAALTVGLARGRAVGSALERAKAVVTEWIRLAPLRGGGHRPLAHGAVAPDGDPAP